MLLRSILSTSLEELPGLAHEPVEVAVVDSGVDATHPDLAGRVAEAFAVEVVDGKPELVETDASENNDLFGHGTAVAGVVASVAPNARIIDIRVLGTQNSGSAEALIAGFQLAVRRRTRIINMSLAAKARFSDSLSKECEKAYLHNLLVVAARRNVPFGDQGLPAELSSTVSVDRMEAAVPLYYRYRPGDLIEFSARGDSVTVPAAGGGYTTMTGSSFATPAISGICALLVGAYPQVRPFEVKAVLKAFAADEP